MLLVLEHERALPPELRTLRNYSRRTSTSASATRTAVIAAMVA